MKQEFSHKASPGGAGQESAKGASLTRGILLSSETVGSLYVCVCAKSLQLCPTLCDPMDCGLPGSSIPGILRARILEWVAMPSSRGSSRPRIEPGSLMSPASGGGFLPLTPPGKPHGEPGTSPESEAARRVLQRH